MIKVAIVILNWNGEGFLKKYLPGVLSSLNNAHHKLFVADNCSSDNSLAYLNTVLPNDQILVFDKNYGYAGGYAKALVLIEASYFVLLNSDIEITQNWIDPVIDQMDKDGSIAAAMPKIRWEKNKDYFEYAGAAGGFIDKYGFPFCRGRILQTLEKDHGQYDDKKEIFWASGACLFLRAKVYHEAGGLDPVFFAHMEEIDLCWRIKNLGHKVMFFPESTVYHVGGGTLSNDNPRKLYLNYRNNLMMLYKNLSEHSLRQVLFGRIIFDVVAASKFFFTLSFTKCWAICKAYHYFFTRIKKRKKSSLNMHSQKKLQGIYQGSIVVDYFLKRRRFFSDLFLK